MTDANTKHTTFVFFTAVTLYHHVWVICSSSTNYARFMGPISHNISFTPKYFFLVRFSQWRNQGRFPGGPAPPYFSTKMRKKFFWRPPPLSQGLDDCLPLPPLSEGLDPPLVVKVKLMYFLPPCFCGGPPHHSIYRLRLC